MILDIPIPTELDSPSAFVMLQTDRNDGGVIYSGVDFDLFLVDSCPTDGHCEANKGGKCIDGYCLCEGNMPCDCTCDGDPPVSVFQTTIFIAVLVPIIVVFAGTFYWYRRRKIIRSRKQKEIIASKEAELEGQ